MSEALLNGCQSSADFQEIFVRGKVEIKREAFILADVLIFNVFLQRWKLCMNTIAAKYSHSEFGNACRVIIDFHYPIHQIASTNWLHNF